MTNTGAVRLRDQRRPGHAWQDNELYDVFQPLIGQAGVALYGNLSRRAYGVTFEYSLRELEERTGISRMTVARTMAVMEHLGMIRMQPGRGRAPGECVLVDLKELAEALGARPVQNGKSHELDAANLTRLRAECAAVRSRMAGKATASGCVPQRDAKSSENGPVCVPRRDTGGTFVSHPEGVCVPPESHASFSVSKPRQKTKAPPLPLPPAGGERGETFALDEQVNRVADACRFTAKGVLRAIRGQLEQRLRACPASSAVEWADVMIANWGEYERSADVLRFLWGPRKFFADGHWAGNAAWPIDQDRMERMRAARVGM